MKILVLDDDKYRHHHFKTLFDKEGNEYVAVYTYHDCIKALEEKGPFDLVHLDHDLNDYGRLSVEYGVGMYGSETVELTGYHVAHYIARKLDSAKHPKLVVIHSWNPSGAKLMEITISGVGIPVRRQEYRGPQSFDKQGVVLGNDDPRDLDGFGDVIDRDPNKDKGGPQGG